MIPIAARCGFTFPLSHLRVLRKGLVGRHTRNLGPVIKRHLSSTQNYGGRPKLIDRVFPPLENRNRLAAAKIYDELHQGQIRVVELHPALLETDPIECALRSLSLASKSQAIFEALSYVWGSVEDPSSINLNGYSYNITKNLEGALRQLRCKNKVRVLWVDALAINQSSIDERNKQVRMMPNIYSAARQTVIWLGPFDQTITPIFDLIKDLDVKGGLDSIDYLHDLDEEAHESFMLSAFKLANNPYWDRAWYDTPSSLSNHN